MVSSSGSKTHLVVNQGAQLCASHVSLLHEALLHQAAASQAGIGPSQQHGGGVDIGMAEGLQELGAVWPQDLVGVIERKHPEGVFKESCLSSELQAARQDRLQCWHVQHALDPVHARCTVPWQCIMKYTCTDMCRVKPSVLACCCYGSNVVVMLLLLRASSHMVQQPG